MEYYTAANDDPNAVTYGDGRIRIKAGKYYTAANDDPNAVTYGDGRIRIKAGNPVDMSTDEESDAGTPT